MTDTTTIQSTDPRASRPHRVEIEREAFTMAFYVAICLLAALTAATGQGAEAHTSALILVWGTTIGLAIAHWFAFRLATRLIAAGAWRRPDIAVAGAQVAGASVVATIASVPLLLLPEDVRFAAARALLAGFLALTGYAVGRVSGASVTRSLAFGAVISGFAFAVALIKNVLGGH